MSAIFRTELQAALGENLAFMKSELHAVKMELASSIARAQSDMNALKHTVGEGVPEDTAAACTTEAVASLLKEAFKLEKEPSLDRWHHTLRPKSKQNELPRPIVVHLHYYKDCVDILNWARTQQRIKIQGTTISIFPDFTMKTARARAAFKDVRRQLREMNLPGLRFGLVFPACLKVSYSSSGSSRYQQTRKPSLNRWASRRTNKKDCPVTKTLFQHGH